MCVFDQYRSMNLCPVVHDGVKHTHVASGRDGGRVVESGHLCGHRWID